MTFRVAIPGVRLVSEANQREHWANKARRVKRQKGAAWLACCRLPALRDTETASVTIVRVIGPRGREIDSDNLQGSAKAIRDAVAKRLGVDDGSDRVVWQVTQEKGEAWVARVVVAVIPCADEPRRVTLRP